MSFGRISHLLYVANVSKIDLYCKMNERKRLKMSKILQAE